MGHSVNTKEVVSVPTEIINKAEPSEILPDSSCVSSEVNYQIPNYINQTVQRVSEKIHGLLPPLPEACIFKVHEELRRGNEEAYTPILVSIGPYHHGKPELHAMEEHKLRYLHSFLQRTNNTNNDGINTSVKHYLIQMVKLADEAHGCYADPVCLERDKFVEMMLLDACFIIEFLCKFWFEELRDKDDPIFRSSWMECQIGRDLMLLENQLPFFVLSKMFDMTLNQDSEYMPLTMMALCPIGLGLLLPANDSVWGTIGQLAMEKPGSESKHFLDLAHNIYLPLFGKDSDSNTTSKSNSSPETCTQMSCVTELQEAGISFKVDDSDTVSIFDINFEHGQMKIPKFKVGDGTETFLRNLVAYEQHSYRMINPKYFTDYTRFMDLLINSEKDVNVLRLHGIIHNMLGSDEVVALMFNKLFDGVIIDPSTFYYSHVCQRVKDHCGRPWIEAMAKLRRNYFNNRWAAISTVAAIVLLLLTLIQTVVALISLFS